MISFENVTKRYQMGKEAVKALDGVSFSIERGSFTVVLGPSGSGKSTALNLLGGMDAPSSGVIDVDGKKINALGPRALTDYRRRDVGFIFQFYNLIPSLNVFENVAIAAKLGGNAVSPLEMLAEVGLSERRAHFPIELSGGEMQRVAIARALCKNPKLLLCDEPTGALDSKTGTRVLALLKRMSKEQGKTVVVVTHNTLIARMANRVIRLKDGTVDEVADNSRDLDVDEVDW
jgi:putative ABC transport system ATP-binding protein